MPSGDTAHSPRPNRVSGESAPLNAADNASWSRRSRFTQNRRASSMMSCSRLAWLTHTTSDGGSTDRDVTAVAVMPCRRVWSAEVMTVTAAGKRRMASLNDERRSSVAASKDIASLLSRRSASSVGIFQLQYLYMQLFVNQKFPDSNLLVWRRTFR